MTKLDLLGRYDAFLLDIDGVLVRGSEALDGAVLGHRRLQEQGRTILLTNNSSRTRKDLADRLTGLGFTVDPEDVVPSSFVAARHLGSDGKTVTFWTVGEAGLEAELRLAGHRPSKRPEDAEWLVAGIDRSMNYAILADALRALSAGARLLATNTDPTLPVPDGLRPGAGAIIGALAGMGFRPEVVVGKPSPIAFRAALDLLDGDSTSVLMIGDRLETDIAGGNEAGLDTALVLTGVTDGAMADESEIRPTWIAESLSALVAGRRESSHR